MSVRINIVENNGCGDSCLDHYEVVGYALVEVRRKDGGELAVEFDVKVDCGDSGYGEEGPVVLPFIKSIEEKIKELLPKPEFVEYPETPESKLWVPDGY